MEELFNAELMKMLRALLPVLLIVLLVVAAAEGYFIKTNSDSINALQAADSILTQQIKLQQEQFAGFRRSYTAENNYMCSVLAEQARLDPKHFFVPPAKVCEVVPPT